MSSAGPVTYGPVPAASAGDDFIQQPQGERTGVRAGDEHSVALGKPAGRHCHSFRTQGQPSKLGWRAGQGGHGSRAGFSSCFHQFQGERSSSNPEGGPRPHQCSSKLKNHIRKLHGRTHCGVLISIPLIFQPCPFTSTPRKGGQTPEGHITVGFRRKRGLKTALPRTPVSKSELRPRHRGKQATLWEQKPYGWRRAPGGRERIEGPRTAQVSCAPCRGQACSQTGPEDPMYQLGSSAVKSLTGVTMQAGTGGHQQYKAKSLPRGHSSLPAQGRIQLTSHHGPNLHQWHQIVTLFNFYSQKHLLGSNGQS